MEIPNAWKGAQRLVHVDFDDVDHVLNNAGCLARDRRPWLRKRIWWSLTDRYRFWSDGSPIPNVSTLPEAEEQANMKAMLELIEQGEMGPGDMVEKDELLRLLGRFDEAVAVLNLVKPDGHSEVRACKVQWFAQSQFAELRML